ncbi:MAG: hypothetical protein IPO83_07530 [Chitinophagaceae bacterium]|nr:hypothetical protein [Chitinophagaceae bacterium]
MIKMKTKSILVCALLIIQVLTSSAQENFNLCEKETCLSNLPVVQKNAKSLLKNSEDNCVLGFLDTLTNGFIVCGSTKYIITLNSICQVSDGYVAEYFEEIVEKLAKKSFRNFSEYMAENKASCLEQFLLEILYTEKDRNDIIQRIDDELKESISHSKRIFLNDLRLKLVR